MNKYCIGITQNKAVDPEEVIVSLAKISETGRIPFGLEDYVILLARFETNEELNKINQDLEGETGFSLSPVSQGCNGLLRKTFTKNELDSIRTYFLTYLQQNV